jgi:hypothetical protein
MLSLKKPKIFLPYIKTCAFDKCKSLNWDIQDDITERDIILQIIDSERNYKSVIYNQYTSVYNSNEKTTYCSRVIDGRKFDYLVKEDGSYEVLRVTGKKVTVHII